MAFSLASRPRAPEHSPDLPLAPPVSVHTLHLDLGSFPMQFPLTCMFFPYFCLYEHQPSLRCGPSEAFSIPLNMVTSFCDTDYYCSNSPSPSQHVSVLLESVYILYNPMRVDISRQTDTEPVCPVPDRGPASEGHLSALTFKRW